MITWPRSLSVALEQRAVDLRALAANAGLPQGALWQPDTRLSLRAYAEILQAAIELVGDPALGLSVGSELRPELFGVVGQIAMLSPTYGDALAMIRRYKHLIAPERLELTRVADQVLIRFIPQDLDAPRTRLQVDAELAGLVAFGRRMTGAPIVPRAIYIAGPKVDYAAMYRDVFGCAATFMADIDAVLLDAVDLALPLRSANPELREVLRAHADAMRCETSREPSSDRVASVLERALPRGACGLDAVASELGMSARSLQRHLRDEGTSFRALVDDTRAQLARRYLTRDDLGLEDIAFLVGFRHVQSFYRAFRRWTGQTPERWNQRDSAD